jgi:solute carrier family 40 (iron-regulated transporter), member 1
LIFVAGEGITDVSASGITMNLSVLLFASLLGTWVDRGASRLATLTMTISANRISVIAACCCWVFIVGAQKTEALSDGDSEVETREVEEVSGFPFGLKATLFVIILFLSVAERLSRTANLFSIERDWVPAMVAPESMSKHQDPPPKFGLAQLNAVMSRIDLVCKLISPIVLSAFIPAVGNLRISILALLCLNGLTWSAEIWSATSVWNSSDRLKEPKRSDEEGDQFDDETSMLIGRLNSIPVDKSGPWWHRSSQRVYYTFQKVDLGIATWLQDYSVNLRIYFAHSVWLPSMALSILHFSVLNYSATLTTYLLISGFSLNLITIAKASNAVAELASTFFTPWGVRKTREVWARYGEKVTLEDDGVPLPSEEEENADLLSEQSQEDQVDVDGAAAFTPKTDMGVAVLGFWSLLQMFVSLVSLFPLHLHPLSIPSPIPSVSQHN